jgi:hypothetical protein
MHTYITKKTYLPPVLARIAIDNEMSLNLVSLDPGDPNGDYLDDYNTPVVDYYNQQPL